MNNDQYIAPVAWSYAVPLLALVVMALVFMLDINQSLFLLVNSTSAVYPGDAFWAYTTVLGDAAVSLSLPALFVGRNPRLLAMSFIAALIAILLIHGLKWGLGILRPAAVLAYDSFHIIGPVLKAKAFPSGHTAGAFVFAGLIGVSHFPVKLKVAVLMTAILVGWSRMAVGAHWPLDVLVGAALGWFSAVVAGMVMNKWNMMQGKSAQIALAGFFCLAAVWLILGHKTGYDAKPMQWLIGIVSLGTAITGFMKQQKQQKN